VPKQALLDASCEKRCEKLEAAFRIVWIYCHEISNHVTVIMGNSDMLYDVLGETAPSRKHLDEIARCARRIGVAASKVSLLKEHFIFRE
jgi:hypothetical protein